MDYSSLKANMKPRHRPRPARTRNKTPESLLDSKLLASKLFSYLICHGAECRLGIPSVAKRLQKFSGDKSYDERKALEFVKSSHEKFVVKTVEGKQFVEAKTSVRLCDLFQEGKCKDVSCKGLHVCRFFLEDSCKFGDECKKPHAFDITQTRALLVHYKLDNLSPDALKALFRKVLNEKKIKHASSTSGPSACRFYNHGDCKNGDKCEFLHVCEHYIDGDCKFGDRCKRNHSFDTAHTRKVLAAHNLGGLRSEKQIKAVLLSHRSLDSDTSDDDVLDIDFLKRLASGGKSKSAKQSSSTKATPHSSTTDLSNEKLEICGFNLRGKCSYSNKCNRLHTSLPYQWQYYLHSQWKNIPDDDNRKVELEFCDYEEDGVKIRVADLGSVRINFQEMTGEILIVGTHILQVPVRRLSTVSSVLAASGHVFRTTWTWYWQDEDERWHCYDNSKAETTSEEIEQQFQSESGKRKHSFTAGSNNYTLYFDDVFNFFQQNDKFGTKRDVRRRPAKYLDEETMKQVLEDFKRSRQRTNSSSGTPSYPVPSTWSPIDPAEEFKLVSLSEVLHHDEYTIVKAQFMKTMTGFNVKSVTRVQNPGLWEEYERQRARITNKNSGNSPDERWLFHGTTKDIVEPICQQGFDWRLSGSKHGARYGKGSYFAVEASYSHTYSSRAVQETYRVFMAKVIVGSYVAGSYDTQRPPPKDASNPLSPLHDSCVNNVAQPTIFVVFALNQAYPYYIIDYTN